MIYIISQLWTNWTVETGVCRKNYLLRKPMKNKQSENNVVSSFSKYFHFGQKNLWNSFLQCSLPNVAFWTKSIMHDSIKKEISCFLVWYQQEMIEWLHQMRVKFQIWNTAKSKLENNAFEGIYYLFVGFCFTSCLQRMARFSPSDLKMNWIKIHYTV